MTRALPTQDGDAPVARAGGGGYRADIDGLRAIAVLSVVVYHLDKRWLPGGYVGVDLFFVISGFLITQILWAGLRRGDFSFAEFYLRRIRRIAPAFFVVTAATLIAGIVLLLPEDLAQLSNSAVWASLSAANVYFWRYLDTGYFAQASDEQPLLHMWSLGVEEQFYLLWPAALFAVAWLIRRRSGMAAAALALAVCVASFAFAEAIVASHPKFAYFMLPARAGELMIGALLVWLRRPGDGSGRAAGIAANLGGIAGLALIAYSLIRLDDASPFPGLNALYPCLGVALVLWGGERPTAVRAMLSLRPLVAVGLVSYSLYLWHWPILAFARYFDGELAPSTLVAAVVAMTALSVLSYRFVERPARRMRGVRWKQVAWLFAVPACVVLAASLRISSTHGLKHWIESGTPNGPALAQLREDVRPAYAYPYNCQLSSFDAGILAQPRCVFGSDPAPRILLWGDSHAAHYIGVVSTAAKAAGVSYRNASHSACPPIFGGVYGSGPYRAGCDAFRPMVERTIAHGDYDVVLMGGNWNAYDSPAFRHDLAETVAATAATGAKVVLLAEAPRFRSYRPACDLRGLRIGRAACGRAVSPEQDTGINRFLRGLASASDKVSFLDVAPVLCRDGSCSPYLRGTAVYYDPAHLSMAGSWRVGDALMTLPAGAQWQAALAKRHVVMASADARAMPPATGEDAFVATPSTTALPNGVTLDFPYRRLFENVDRGNRSLRVLVEYAEVDAATVERRLSQAFVARGFSSAGRHVQDGRIVLEFAHADRTRVTATIEDDHAADAQAERGRLHLAWSNR